MKKLFAVCAAVALLGCSLSMTACAEGESYGLAASSVDNGKIILTQTSAKAGERVRLACLPDAGYTLKGYKVDGAPIDGCAFTMPSKDVEVSAEFAIIEYNIEYVLDGGTVEAGNPVKYTVEDGEIALKQPHKDGYEFGGWYYYFHDAEHYYADPDDYKVEKISAGTIGELTLYARYYNSPHEITVDDTNSTKVFVDADAFMAEMGETVNLSYYMYSEYYTFVCFTVDGEDIEGDSFVMPNKDVVIGARLQAIEFSISYVLDGGINSPDNPTTYTYDDDVVDLYKPTKEGYEFIGWYYDENFEDPATYYSDGEWFDGIYGYIAENLTLYALFVPVYEEE
ncbi:MAG: InlB B-repeat-containing protein [Clostridia bacterium]|nr:InlB B-repeat-containing protein [Clostridia bacterium]